MENKLVSYRITFIVTDYQAFYILSMNKACKSNGLPSVLWQTPYLTYAIVMHSHKFQLGFNAEVCQVIFLLIYINNDGYTKRQHDLYQANVLNQWIKRGSKPEQPWATQCVVPESLYHLLKLNPPHQLRADVPVHLLKLTTL